MNLQEISRFIAIEQALESDHRGRDLAMSFRPNTAHTRLQFAARLVEPALCKQGHQVRDKPQQTPVSQTTPPGACMNFCYDFTMKSAQKSRNISRRKMRPSVLRRNWREEILRDWLNCLLDPAFSTTVRPAYAPFGEQYATAGTTDASFTGQNSDAVGSFYDFTFRKDSPSQGRWISPDPLGRGAASRASPQSWNRYAYVANKPLSFVDPLGLNLQGPGGGGCNPDLMNCFGGDGTGDSGSGGAFGFILEITTSASLYFTDGNMRGDGSPVETDPTSIFINFDAGGESGNGPYITPGATSSRLTVIKILSQANDCSAFFNDAALSFTEGANTSAVDIFSATDIRLNPNRPTVGAQSFQGEGWTAPIFLNPNGPFFISIPGTPTYLVGPFTGGTPQAQVTILLHEFAHTINAIPSDSSNVPLSEANTTTVLRNCQAQINPVAP